MGEPIDTSGQYRDIEIERPYFEHPVAANLTPKQLDLAVAMSYVSEDLWFAGWMSGCEFTFWRAMQGEDAGEHIPPEWLQVFRELSAEIGGWIVWRGGETLEDIDDWGCYFVPIDEWRAAIAKAGGEA